VLDQVTDAAMKDAPAAGLLTQNDENEANSFS
jgi:hypothetical protein